MVGQHKTDLKGFGFYVLFCLNISVFSFSFEKVKKWTWTLVKLEKIWESLGQRMWSKYIESNLKIKRFLSLAGLTMVSPVLFTCSFHFLLLSVNFIFRYKNKLKSSLLFLLVWGFVGLGNSPIGQHSRVLFFYTKLFTVTLSCSIWKSLPSLCSIFICFKISLSLCLPLTRCLLRNVI